MSPITAWSEDNQSATLFRQRMNFDTTAIDSIVRGGFSSGTVPNGNLRLTCFTPSASMTVSQITVAVATAGTDSGGTTVRRFGLYTVGASRAYTLVARTASDATIGNTSSSLNTRSFDTTGGYPSTYNIVAGTTYAIGVLCYNTGGTFNSPTFVGLDQNNAIMATVTPRMMDLVTGQTDVAGNVTGASNTSFAIWSRLS